MQEDDEEEEKNGRLQLAQKVRVWDWSRWQAVGSVSPGQTFSTSSRLSDDRLSQTPIKKTTKTPLHCTALR